MITKIAIKATAGAPRPAHEGVPAVLRDDPRVREEVQVVHEPRVGAWAPAMTAAADSGAASAARERPCDPAERGAVDSARLANETAVRSTRRR